MSKFVETKYTNTKEILKFPDHYVNLAITVSDASISSNAEGKKIVPAGTIIGGNILNDESALGVKATTDVTSNAVGVLFHDVDVSHGPASGALLIHGFVDLNKIPAAPTAEEKAALNQITFLK